jgi:hypothetical protein
MIVKRSGPCPPQRVGATTNSIRRNTQGDSAVTAQVDEVERPNRSDFCIKPSRKLALRHQEGTDDPVPLIPQDRFKEADRQGLAEIKHTEAMTLDPAPGIAEPAARHAEAQ